MATSRLYVRTVVQLREIYLQRAVQAMQQAFVNRLSDFEYHKQEASTWFRQAITSGWSGSSIAVRRHLALLVVSLGKAVGETVAQLRQPFISVPDLRLLLQELEQLDEEFGNLKIDPRKKLFSVTIEPIELEDVYLGSFEIRLAWSRLRSQADSQTFEIVALDPHPADGKPNVTHPHISDQKLCAGEAALPIKRALEQGRLADAFCLVRSVLLHYNPESPYVALDDWYGGECCFNCGARMDSDDFDFCETCGHDYCDECAAPCSRCERMYCDECLGKCELCELSSCGACRKRCAVCGGRYCTGCLQAEGSPNRLICTRCRATPTVAANAEVASQSNITSTPLECPHESPTCTTVN